MMTLSEIEGGLWSLQSLIEVAREDLPDPKLDELARPVQLLLLAETVAENLAVAVSSLQRRQA